MERIEFDRSNQRDRARKATPSRFRPSAGGRRDLGPAFDGFGGLSTAALVVDAARPRNDAACKWGSSHASLVLLEPSKRNDLFSPTDQN
ncbi:hypothetical protein NL676_025931 [Syzygium grande]|nr:hypothetical protein NL676_025931 [Syzygium grande]